MRAADSPPHLRSAIPAWEEFTVMREILVIDDDKLTRWSLARVLTRAGYRVREASSASEGLTRVQEAAPDLVFLDCRLPDGDGASVLQMLQEIRPRLPVVMISADAPREAVRCLCRLGAHGYLEKPCSPTLVVALADSLLRPPT
jgi:DNA-binding NtrC family response regulator